MRVIAGTGTAGRLPSQSGSIMVDRMHRAVMPILLPFVALLVVDLSRAATAPGGAAADPDAVFADAGLKKNGFVLILPEEAEIHAALAHSREVKSAVSSETLARSSLKRQYEAAFRDLNQLQGQLSAMDHQMEQVKGDSRQYNQLVGPYNQTLADAKQRHARMKDLKDQFDKLHDSRDAYRDSILTPLHVAQTAMARYTALSGDARIKSAIDRYNASAPQKVKLGPSGQFTQDLAMLRKLVNDAAAEGVPARMGNGTPIVPVTINGVTVPMIWDSGASDVALSAETADKLGIHPTAHAQTVSMMIADGSRVEAKVVTIPSISVGVFTATNVQCSISPPVGRHVDDLLGGTFQRHFICRVDQSAGVIHLTPRDESASIGGMAAAAPASGAGAPAESPAGDAVVEGPFAEWKLNNDHALLVLPAESALHSATLKVHGLRTRLESEMNERAGVNRAIDAAMTEFKRTGSQLNDLEKQIAAEHNPNDRDGLIVAYNETLRRANQQMAQIGDLRRRLGKVDDSQAEFQDALVVAIKLARPTAAQYDTLAKDRKLVAAMSAYNAKKTSDAVTLGPSPQFQTDTAFLRGCVEQFLDEVVPARMDSGTPLVAATINGKRIPMVWDSGATYVSLSAETADELGIHPTDKDPTVITMIADGSKVRSKMVVLPSLSLGLFTAKNVECIIDPKGANRSPDLLGGSFQRHFLCRVDQQAGVIHLTPSDASASISKATKTPATQAAR